MNKLLRSCRAMLIALCLGATSAQASVVIGGTRVIFPAQTGEVTLRLSNTGDQPALVEAWIDRGDAHSTPDKVDTPFLITPPLFRMEAHKDQTLRIIATQPSLPEDRESLFWLNVLEIPPKPTGEEMAGQNLLQFAIRSRLKLFYRPANLPGDALNAASQITWKAVPVASGYALEIHNPTPYHITIQQAALNVGGKSYATEAGMVDPLGKLRLPLKDLTTSPDVGTAVAYEVINDYGATTPLKGSIAP